MGNARGRGKAPKAHPALARAQSAEAQKAVLVTGASSGIGRKIAERLASKGYFVIVVAPLIEADEKDIQFIFNVNVFGPYRITKAFAPMLLASKGRVVNISSLNGIVASPMIGAYSMTKHADAVFDALSSANPKPRYLVVPVANQAAIPIRKLIDEVVQLNETQKFTYDRDALVRMLDDALARAKQRP
jgi:hypothetical protein